ncbi:MAG: hypothetical protein C0483_00565 [Pirellula sp.]|nr:hypothetical protein [Pirellula sp.]
MRIIRTFGMAAGVVALIGLTVSAVGQAAAAEVRGWRTATTEHFVVQAVLNDAQLTELGERCEALLGELRAKWFDDGVATDWAPRCLVVVHGSAATYLQAVPGGERTLGSSWIETKEGKIVTRRVDLRADRVDWFAGALAHELVHVLLADRVGGYPPARWAEEGLAILADPTDKQQRHEADFRAAAAQGGEFRLAEMLGHTEYPDATRITAFYGQSASLVRFLIKFRTPADFSAFLKHSASYGYDAALRSTYGINGIADLERRWLNSVHSEELAIR